MIYKDVELYNVHELLDEGDDGSKTFSRIPNALRLGLNSSAMNNAVATPGSEVRFNLTGDEARITLKDTGASPVPAIVEVYQGSFLSSVHTIGLDPTEVVVTRHANTDRLGELTRSHDLPYDIGLSRVILPWRPPCRLLSIEGETTLPRADQTPDVRYLAYGSSITHGSNAVRPTGTYAMRTAQFLSVDLISLGFGGGAHLEPSMADYISGRDDWDFASMELGINLLGSIEVEEFERRVAYFIPTIARAHPDKWIFCIDVFPCRWDFAADPKADAFRTVVKKQVEALNLPKLVHVSGMDMLSTMTGLTADLVHPSPSGMEEMARYLAGVMSRKGCGNGSSTYTIKIDS
jgi:hypothetical protein